MVFKEGDTVFLMKYREDLKNVFTINKRHPDAWAVKDIWHEGEFVSKWQVKGGPAWCYEKDIKHAVFYDGLWTTAEQAAKMYVKNLSLALFRIYVRNMGPLRWRSLYEEVCRCRKRISPCRDHVHLPGPGDSYQCCQVFPSRRFDVAGGRQGRDQGLLPWARDPGGNCEARCMRDLKAAQSAACDLAELSADVFRKLNSGSLEGLDFVKKHTQIIVDLARKLQCSMGE